MSSTFFQKHGCYHKIQKTSKSNLIKRKQKLLLSNQNNNAKAEVFFLQEIATG